MRRIGGSDIPKLLGISKYGNDADVYMRIVEGAESQWSKNMERGAAVEPLLRAYAQRTLGLELEIHDSDICIHPGNEFAHAQIDDRGEWRGQRVAVDFKSQSTFSKGWGPDLSSVVPAQYLAQMSWELACCDRDLGLLIVGFGQDVPPPGIFDLANVMTYLVERDGVYESHLLQVAGDFWRDFIVPRKPPDMKPIGKYLIAECA